MVRPVVVAAALLSLPFCTPDVLAQIRPPAPLPQGERITAQNGDTILLEGDAQIRIVRRREASIRVVFNRAEGWLVLIADYASKTGEPDGRVDWSYHYRDVSGEWPMAERWEGRTTLEEYGLAPIGGMSGLAFTGPAGTIHLLNGPPQANNFHDPNAAAVLTSRGSGSGIRSGTTFDAAEALEIANARRSANGGAQVQTLPGGGTASLEARVSLASTPEPINGVPPVRVGGNVRPPEKIVDVAPQLPEVAARAGVRGVVILEITIAPDGTVRNPRILRSIPLLDAAALEAVRQWRYSPPTANGSPVPVVMTVTVPFQ